MFKTGLAQRLMGRRFDGSEGYRMGLANVARSTEHWIVNPEVEGSTPAPGATRAATSVSLNEPSKRRVTGEVCRGPGDGSPPAHDEHHNNEENR